MAISKYLTKLVLSFSILTSTTLGFASVKAINIPNGIEYQENKIQQFKDGIEEQAYDYTLSLCYAYEYYNIGGSESSFSESESVKNNDLKTIYDQIHKDLTLKKSLKVWADSIKKGAFASFVNFRGDLYNNKPEQFLTENKASYLENLFVSDFHHFLFESKGYSEALLHCLGPDMKRWNHFTNILRGLNYSSGAISNYALFFMIPGFIIRGIVNGFTKALTAISKATKGYSSALLKLTAISGISYLAGKAEHYRVNLNNMSLAFENYEENIIQFRTSIQRDLTVHRYKKYQRIISYSARWSQMSDDQKILNLDNLETRIASVEGEADFIIKTIHRLESNESISSTEINILKVFKQMNQLIEIKNKTKDIS